MEEVIQQLKIIRAACYDRVSTPKQKTDKTIDSQIAATEAYCRKMGYEIFDHYADDGWGGALSARPETARLIADAQAGLFDVVVCMSVDRMSRDSEFYWNIVPAIRRAGVKIIYVQTPNMGDEGGLMENVLIGVAAGERKTIATRLATGKRWKVVGKKIFMGHRPPYGFKYIRDRNDRNDPGHLEFHDEHKKILEMIFHWIAREGMSANNVIKRLSEMKIPSPRGYPIWTKATFLAMVKNEAYLGKFWYYRHESVIPKKYRENVEYRKNPKTGHRLRPREDWVLVEIPELRIIDDETFELVREALKRNRQFSKRNTKRETLLGGGLIICESCNGSYYAGSFHQRDEYICGNKLRRFPLPKNCTAEIKSVSAPRIEGIVWKLVCKVLGDPDFLIAQLEENRDMFQKQRSDTLRDLELVEVQIADKEAEEVRLVLAVQKGMLRENQIAEASKKLNFDKAFLIGHRKELQEKLKEVEVSEGARRDIKQFCAQAGNGLDKLTFEGRQEVVRMVIKKIICNGKKIRVRFNIPIRGGKENDPEIVLNPIKPRENANFGIIANNRLQYIIRNYTSKWEFEVSKKL